MKTHICANITNYCRSQTLFYWSITDASAEVRFTLPVDYSTCKLSVYILRYMYDTRYGADHRDGRCGIWAKFRMKS